MLIYSKEPLNVMMKNILLLDDQFTGGYVYVNKETYDQALSLYVTFNQDILRVKQTISGKGMLNWEANKKISHVVSVCSEYFSSPLNMLAPYLAYTLPIGVEWPEDDEEMIKMAYGILHQMSQFTNFYATALMPAGAKADITIPKNIIMAYEDSWRAQLETLDKCVVAVPVYVERAINVEPSADELHVVQITEEVQNSAKPVEESVPEEVTVEEPKVEESVAQAESEESTDEGAEEATTDTAEQEDDQTAEDSNDAEGDDDEIDYAALEAKILAQMKEIEDAPSEEYAPKEPDEDKTVETPKETSKEEKVNFGESGTINMTEQQIAAGNRAILNDYDI